MEAKDRSSDRWKWSAHVGWLVCLAAVLTAFVSMASGVSVKERCSELDGSMACNFSSIASVLSAVGALGIGCTALLPRKEQRIALATALMACLCVLWILMPALPGGPR